MNRNLSVLGPAALIAAGLVVATVTSAAGGNSSHETTIRFLDLGPNAAHGVISSDRGYCEERRFVVLQRFDGERYRPSGANGTHKRGSWRVRAPLDPGKYRVRVFAVPAHEGQPRCGGDTSSSKRLSTDPG